MVFVLSSYVQSCATAGRHDITDADDNSNQLDETSKLQALRLQDSKTDESKDTSAELR